MSERRAAGTCLGTVLLLALGAASSAQSGGVITRVYGRAAVDVETARARPGGVLAVGVRNARWTSANTLMDGRRAALSNETGRLFGLIPLALDTAPGDHKLSLFFPGRRGVAGATSVVVPVNSGIRTPRARPMTPESLAIAVTQTALGHGRFLLAAIRTRDLAGYHTGPLHAPVDRPISFPFGGIEDYGMTMGPLKDGLVGEHHRGVDYELLEGTPVKAPGSGIVLLARSLAFSGETVVIGHGRGLVSVLAHLTHVSVREGDVVNPGTAIGSSGKTGIGASTPHLCFSVYLHSINVDPEVLMDASLWPPAR